MNKTKFALVGFIICAFLFLLSIFIKYDASSPSSGFSKEDIIYFIMVDRFADSSPEDNLSDVNPNDLKKFQGGDIKGITSKLDYIKSLGATAIWITPIMKNGTDGYHGYWINDFYQVDEHFGTMEDLKEMVNQAHQRDLKVIFDYVVNHTGYDSPWLSAEDKKKWYHQPREISNWHSEDDLELGWLAGLPDLDQSNPDVEKYFLENALWWIDETGVDGYRLDTVRHVSVEFWTKFTSTIHEKYPDFFFIGEVFDKNVKNLEKYHQTGIQSITNYSLYNGMLNGFNVSPNMLSLANSINNEKTFTSPELNAIFIDNHDNTRFITTNKTNGEVHLKQALTFLYTYPSIPVLYYGTEINMAGENDPYNREFMAWDKTKDSASIKYIQELVEIRKQYAGNFQMIANKKEYIAYEITNGDAKLLIVINGSSKPYEATFNYTADQLIDYYSDLEVPSFSNNVFSKSLEPFEILFLKVK